MSVALITGGSAGLGLALTRALATDGWTVLTDARSGERLHEAVGDLGDAVVALPGDVADAGHRAELATAVVRLGRLDLLVHGASTLGPLPLRALRDLSPSQLHEIWTVNAAAPVALTQLVLPALKESDGVLVSVTSDAAVEHYESWGGYAASKAALDSLTLTLGAEEGITAYTVDPGDMRTQMHQDAFPGEDISDRPVPATVVPRILALVAGGRESGRYRAADIEPPVGAGTGAGGAR